MIATRLLPAAAAALLLVAVVATACGEDPPPPPAAPPGPEDVVVRLGPAAITAGEIADWVEMLATVDPRLGVDYRRRVALDKHLIPLALARHEFPERRAELRQQAQSLHNVIASQGPLELRKRGGRLGGVDVGPASFNQLPLAQARFAFRAENFGVVSPPIETPQGWVVLAVTDRQEGLTTIDTRLTAHVVPFITHARGQFAQWYDGWKARLRELPREVHPDYRHALPTWLDR